MLGFTRRKFYDDILVVCFVKSIGNYKLNYCVLLYGSIMTVFFDIQFEDWYFHNYFLVIFSLWIISIGYLVVARMSASIFLYRRYLSLFFVILDRRSTPTWSIVITLVPWSVFQQSFFKHLRNCTLIFGPRFIPGGPI